MIGELNIFLGLQVKQMKHGTFLCQSKYCRELMKKFEMDKCKEATTPISTSCYLDLDEKGVSIDQTKCRGLIGSLLYLTTSWLDIMFSVYVCVRFQSNPKESYFKAGKRILKYLKGTINVSLWYPRGVSLSLIGYSDSDFASCKLDQKSTSGTCHLLWASLISWHSKKQACVTLSTTEAKYIATRSCCVQILWLNQQLSDYDLTLSKIPLKCDNTSAINLTKNPVTF